MSSLRLIVLVLEGYAYIAIVVATLIGVPALLAWGLLSRSAFVGLIAILIGVPLLLVAVTAVRALLFRVPGPDGVRLAPADAPELHDEIESIRKAVGAPRVHGIFLIRQFNASAMQLPRFGVFWPKNYLLLGFPLFAALPTDQMRAVIAHELAHLSRSHGRLALLVYRLRLSWARLLRALNSSTPTYALYLFRWYAPRLEAHSRALARRHELAVDRISARVAGVEPTAASIVALGLIGETYEDLLWRDLERDEADHRGPYSRVQPDVWAVLASEGEARLQTLLSETTDEGDTHPAVAERLSNLGATARVLTRPDRTAGDVWLGAHASTISAQLDEEWFATQGARWRDDRAERRESRARLRVLEGMAELTPAQLYEKADLIESLEGTDAAYAIYEEAAAAGDASAALVVGTIMLERDDDRGIALIEQAVTADESLGTRGNLRIAEFLQSRGQIVEANRYATLARAAETRATLAAVERRELSPVDRFGPHELGDAALGQIAASLARTSEVQAALLVRKELRHSVGSLLILAVDANDPSSSLRERLLAEGTLADHPVSDIVVLGRFDAALRHSLGTVPGAAIFRRK